MLGEVVIAIDDDPPVSIDEQLKRMAQVCVDDSGALTREGTWRGQCDTRREIEAGSSGDGRPNSQVQLPLELVERDGETGVGSAQSLLVSHTVSKNTPCR